MKKFLLTALATMLSLNATIEVGYYSMNNKRNKQNEDRVIIPLGEETNNTLLADNTEFIIGIFDGHAGHQVSDYLIQNINQQLFAALNSCNGDIASAFKSAFNTLDCEILKSEQLQVQGSTAIVGYVKNSELTLANVGDSKAIVFDITEQNTNIASTIMHKPEPTSQEGKRITECGGVLNQEYSEWRAGYYNKTFMYYDIGMSRSFGDINFKKIGIISEPDVSTPIKIQTGKTCVVLASDGLWDVFTPEEVVFFIQNLEILENDGPNNICKQLTLRARIRGSYDDITVAMIFF